MNEILLHMNEGTQIIIKDDFDIFSEKIEKEQGSFIEVELIGINYGSGDIVAGNGFRFKVYTKRILFFNAIK